MKNNCFRYVVVFAFISLISGYASGYRVGYRAAGGQIPSLFKTSNFSSPTPEPITTTTFRNVYQDDEAKFKLSFPGTMYVERTAEKSYLPSSDGMKYSSAERYGTIRLGFTPNLDESSIQIDYSIPVLDGKGGACMDVKGNSKYKTVFLDGVKAESTCQYTIAYPVHPKNKIEYMIFISGTEQEMKKYYDLVIEGWKWL